MPKRMAAFFREQATKAGPGILARLATYMDYQVFKRRQASASAMASPPERGTALLLELETTGICIVPSFWTEATCAQARSEVDRVIDQYPAYVNSTAKADVRVYGANNASGLIDLFAQDPLLLSVASAYNREPTSTAFTLAARMPASEGNQGSGEGWHRDAFLRQIKAILYLSDVSDDNGPFQWVADSHRPEIVLEDMRHGGLRYEQYRLRDDEVRRVVAREPAREKTFAANAGTLILVDTSAVHRGMPIRKGTRYALTNYYFPMHQIKPSLTEKFTVLPPSAAGFREPLLPL